MKMTGAQIIIEALIEQGVETVFGYPGGQVLNIYDELYKNSHRINHVLAAHEQGAAHAADGYFRATGKTGVVIATSGPGATNLVTGIATAMLDSVPMVAITGNVPCDLIGRDSFQEIDITGITLPITKHNYFVNNVEDLAFAIREAFQIARSGRPGPVLIDVPKDIQIALTEFENEPIFKKFENSIAPDEKIEAALELINAAKKPYIYIGGGAMGAGVEEGVQELAEKIDGVIGCSLMGLSAVPTDNPRFLGMQGMHGHYASSMAQNNADLILAVGVRFSDRATGNKKKYAKNAKIIQLDIDFAEINKNINVDLGIYGDIHDAFGKIAKGVKEKKNPEWMEFVKGLIEKEESSYIKTDKLTPKTAIDIINDTTTPETVIATDVGQHQMWAAQYVNFKKSRKFVSSGGLGTMGFGLGAAIGAAIGSNCPTVLITGDGSFGMNLNELATAVSTNANVKIVIFNNGVLGMVRQWQTLFYNKHYSSTTLARKTDFVKLAEAFGADGYRVSTPEEFSKVFKTAFEKDGPVLIDCAIDKDEFVLPMLPPGGSIDDIIVEKEVDSDE
ncbi:MAG: biosynthetic-type acetolactate synthase large subunit [Oscillospiraceae bacterium]|nr:biosynthetic-type acetolactate synthase large subunit [Oscillospiraceae bacterium]